MKRDHVCVPALLVAYLGLVLAGSAGAGQNAPGKSGSEAQQGPLVGSGFALFPERSRKESDFIKPSGEAMGEARRLYDAGRLAEAEKQCRRAVDLSRPGPSTAKPTNLAALRLLGEILLDQGRDREALACFRQCYPSLYSTALDWATAVALCRVGDYQGALAHYRAILRKEGEDPDAKTGPDISGVSGLRGLHASVLLSRASYLASVDARSRALASLDEAVRIVPESVQARLRLGAMLFDLGKASESLTQYRAAEKLSRGALDAATSRRVRWLESYLSEDHRADREKWAAKQADTATKP